jgi:cell division protein FtsI (penicillin-binding protein 3)
MSEVKKEILSRFGLVYLIYLLFSIFILIKIFYLQFAEGSYLKSKALELSQKSVSIPPIRGDIISSDGKVLATSIPYYEIRLDFRAEGLKKDTFYKYLDSLSIYLAQIFQDKDASTYKKELKEAYKRGLRYYLLKKRVDHQIYKTLKRLPLFRLGQNKGGFIAIKKYFRIKPYEYLASRTIGYLSQDKTIVGVEGSFNSYLKGKEGLQQMQRVSGNVWIPINSENTVEPQDGYDVVSCIDVNIQDVAHHALLSNLEKHAASYGTAIVMETKTGEIKAIANLQYDSALNKYIEKFNIAIGLSIEPGSTFKLISLMAALEEGCIKITDSVNTGNGEISYFGVKMKDAHEGGYGKISVLDVFAYSSNVGTSKIIKSCFDSKPKAFVNRLYNLHLHEKLGLDIKGEGRPIIKDPSDTSWSGLTLPWMSIGYEVKLTPMQIITVYNAVANNGVMVKPKLVKALKYKGEIVKSFETEVINPSICSKETLEALKKMLEAVVEKGTAKNLKNPTYKIAGKTGTAQVAKGRKGYIDDNSKKTYLASFVGYFPAENPAYTIMVVVGSPSKSVYYGNIVAGPIFKEIADKIYATHVKVNNDFNVAENKIYVPSVKKGETNDIIQIAKQLNIPYKLSSTQKFSTVTPNNNTFQITPINISKNKMPDIIGMGIRDAVHILENLGLNVRIIGRGKIIKQSIRAGSEIKKGDIVFLELS